MNVDYQMFCYVTTNTFLLVLEQPEIPFFLFFVEFLFQMFILFFQDVSIGDLNLAVAAPVNWARI